jgi:hypothetical protein
MGVVRIRDNSSASFQLIAPPRQQQSYKIVVADGILTPRSDLQIQCAPPRVRVNAVQRLWQAVSPQREQVRPELQSPSSSRRIWTRELLPLRACRLDRQTWFETQTISAHYQEHRDPDLIPAGDLQPAPADLQRAPAPALESASAACNRSIRRMAGHLPQKPRLIGPQIKLTFDLQPLKR